MSPSPDEQKRRNPYPPTRRASDRSPRITAARRLVVEVVVPLAGIGLFAADVISDGSAEADLIVAYCAMMGLGVPGLVARKR